MKILIGCNLLASIDSIAYSNHMQFWYNLGKKFGPETQFVFYAPRRMSIDHMRNNAAKLALANECDYLFFYDDDVLLPDNTLERLIAADRDIAAGITLVRSTPYNPMIFRYVKTGTIYSMTCYDDYEENIDEKGLLECDAVGFSCCLIKVSALKRMQPPYFVTGPDNTEDVYFCHKYNQENRSSRKIHQVVVDTKVVTGHLLDKYYVSPDNAKSFKELEKSFGNIAKGNKRQDRSSEYREQVLERLKDAQEVKLQQG